MKRVFILFFVLKSLFVWCAVDPAPDHARFKLDPEILRTGAYISLIDNNNFHNFRSEDRIQPINSSTDTYIFHFPGKYFKIKIQFKDSTEKVSSFINNKSFYSVYEININKGNNLVISDITNQIRTKLLLKFIVFASILFLIIKIFPTWFIIYPDNTREFLKRFGLTQVIYSLLFSILVFLFHKKGLLISVLMILASIAIDYRILNEIYFDKRKAVIISIILSLLLTIFFSFYYLVAFIALS